jgi:Uma2 family endonuclease
VEVSDSTISFDRNHKWRLYAHEGIPIYWIVNLVALRLEVYTDPSGPSDTPGYSSRKDYGPGEEVPLVLDGREVGRIAVNDLFP